MTGAYRMSTCSLREGCLSNSVFCTARKQHCLLKGWLGYLVS